MEKLKIAFIGCGGRNGAHVQKCMARDDLEYVGFCDVLEEKALAVSLENSAKAALCIIDHGVPEASNRYNGSHP
mgnify:CR=1 FL=1